MLNEIINVYSKQLELYTTLKKTLERVQKSDFDIISYNLEFENADFILNQIEKLNKKAEQLKLIYISKHNIEDFNGEEIKTIESAENYCKLQEVIKSITKIISEVKQIQDFVINRINQEKNINKKVQSSTEKKNVIQLYKSNLDKK